MKDMETRYVCDRCKKEVTAFLRMETTRVSAAGILVTGSYLLCDKCADDFTDDFMNKTQSVMRYEDTGDHNAWACPQCHSKYVFWIGSGRDYKPGQDPVRVCYADEVFTTQVSIPRSYFRSGKDVAFECPTCKRLLYVPDSIIKEVNK